MSVQLRIRLVRLPSKVEFNYAVLAASKQGRMAAQGHSRLFRHMCSMSVIGPISRFVRGAGEVELFAKPITVKPVI